MRDPGVRRRRFVLLAWLSTAQGLACSDRPSPAPGDAAAPDAGSPEAVDAAGERAAAPCDVLGAPIARLAYSTDGRRLAIADRRGRVAVLQLDGPGVGSIARELAVAPAPSVGPQIALTEDGGVLAAAASGEVSLWSVADGRLLRRLPVGGGDSRSLKFSDAPAPLLLAGFDASANPADNVKVWRIADAVLVASLSGSPVATFTHADEAVLMLDESGAGYSVLSFGGRLLRRGTLPRALARPAFAADGAFLGGVIEIDTPRERVGILSVSDDGFVWESTGSNPRTRELLFLENPSRVVQLAERALVYDHTDGQVLMALPALDTASLVVPAPDGATLAAVGADGRLVFVSTTDGSVRAACP